MIEVVLAIAVGLIIIAGVSVGYTYAKRAAILDNQRKNVAAIKTYVEQAIAAQQANIASGGASNCQVSGKGICAPALTMQQLGQLALRLPSLKTDPYTGAARVDDNGNVSMNCYGSSGGSCIGINSAGGDNFWTTGKMQEFWGGNWIPGAGSGVFYWYNNGNIGDTFSLVLGDGTNREFYGYMVVESDSDGNIVAAEGGDATLAQWAAQ